MFRGAFNYLVIHKLKLAFGDVAKCGSSTIKRLVVQYDYPGVCYKKEECKILYQWGEFPSNYRKIIFVRNQFSRILSSYFHFRTGIISDYHKSLYQSAKNTDFETFLTNNIFYKEYFYDYHFKSMRHFLSRCNEDTEIYRFENFAEIMKNIMQVDEIPHVNGNMLNNEYKNYYNLRTKLMILEFYKWDMINLNYDFNGITGDLPTLKSLDEFIGDRSILYNYKKQTSLLKREMKRK